MMLRYFCKVATLLVVRFFLFILVLALAAGNNCVSAFDYPSAGKDVNDFSFYKPASETEPYPPIRGSNVRNIIFCIGDGMGLGQVALARLTAAGPDGKLYMERMPVTALVRTHSANALVTDSAASATALATGFKTNNGMVGMLPDGRKPLTILEAAKELGMATGLVATSAITDATPACFGAHVKNRRNQTKIAEDLIANKIDVLLGGGRQYFLPGSDANSERKDKKDLISKAENSGYCYCQTAEELKSVQGTCLLGLFQLGPLTTEAPEPTLAELTEKAIEVLSKNTKGFFLMVEGSQIDWACHDNDANNTIKQTLRFDEAVGSALKFAARDKHTLVVVTADHETGALAVTGAGSVEPCWATKGHSALPVPLYAFGPGAEMFAGVYDNTRIPKRFAQLLGIKPFPRITE
jgi:alkaline phosphatase